MSPSVVASNPSSASATLLGQLREGRAEAWQRFCDLFGPTIYRWSRRAGLSPEDSADVLQEVLRAVSRTIGSFHQDQPGQSFLAWLATITRNKIHDHYRRAARQPQPLESSQLDQLAALDAADEQTGTPAAITETQTIVRRALDLLQTEFELPTWQAFWRVTVDEAPPAEVAVALGLTVNAVYKAKSRVMRRLREELAGLVEMG